MSRDISRRSFLKYLGGGMVASSALLAACKQNARTGSPTGGDGAMTLRTNPNNGDRVSLLGYGMMRLPVEGGGTDRDHPDSPIDQELVNEQVDYALAHGVNYFDTSPAYCQGRSERATGIALKRHPRHTYYIATKLSNFNTFSRQESIDMFNTSLRELQTDYVDYLLLHGVGMGGMEALNARYIDNGILDWLVSQKAAGRVRQLGFSYHGDVAVFDTLLQWHDEGRYHWDFVQIELNYLDWNFADEINPRNTDAVYLYGELRCRGIPAVIMEPLLGGRLANVPEFIVRKMKVRRSQDSVASWAFRFAGTPEGVLTVLSGMTYTENLIENCATYSPLEPINSEENDFLMDVAEDIYNLHTIPCNECNYCMPCPYGLNIPALFAHYNKCVKEGYVSALSPHTDDGVTPRKEHDRSYRQARRAYLVGYDRSVPRLRQADKCIGCGQCMEHCPQNIHIPQEMEKLDHFVEQLRQDPQFA